jgi:type II secretion system protein G
MERTKKSGFTLIEMMIVIVVISILVGTLLPQFKGSQDEASVQRAKSELRTLATAVESYYIHNNAYPTNQTTFESGLIAATPRIITTIPDDPFRAAGTNYTYYLDTNSAYYAVVSFGPDRATDISGINTSGQLTESGDCNEDIVVTNGTRTDASGNACSQ